MIWTEGPEKLKIFVDYLNNLHSTVNFTCSHSPTNIPFLDVMVSIKDGFIETDLYTKPTDKHQYLLISSCHPQHTKRSIPYSLALRLRRICSNHDSYIMRTTELIDYLVRRGYDKTFLKPKYRGLLTFLALTHLKTNPGHRLKPFPSLLHIIQHYLTSRASFTSILTSSTHQIVVEMFLKIFR